MREVIQSVIATEAEAREMVAAARAEADRIASDLQQRSPDLVPKARLEAQVEAELLDVDDEYRRAAAAGTLKQIAPRRFNPTGEAWLPILHTARGQRHYTALFSNTPHAQRQQKTRDWVVLFHDDDQGEQRCTIITSEFGPLQGRRIVRGRETECEQHYRQQRWLPGIQARFQAPER